MSQYFLLIWRKSRYIKLFNWTTEKKAWGRVIGNSKKINKYFVPVLSLPVCEWFEPFCGVQTGSSPKLHTAI